MTRLAVDHIQLPILVGGAARARDFYEHLLGLREVRDPTLDRPGVLRYALGAQRLDLSEGPYSGVAPQAHLALRVQGLRALAERLRQAQLPVDTGAARAPGARLYVDDPFGNRLEFIEALSLASQESAYDAEPIAFAV